MPQATVGIDCRLGGVRHGGIGRYIAEYLRQVVLDTDLRFSLLFSDEEQQRELLQPISTRIQSRLQLTIATIRHYSLAEQLRLPAILNQLNVDILHVPHFNVPLAYRRPFVVTIHDLLWHSTRGTAVTTLPSWQYWAKYAAYQLTVKETIHRAKRIFTPTNFVADSIRHHYPNSSQKLVVAYEGVGEQFISTSTKRDPQQLLYVGSLYPHKNVGIILQALTSMKQYRLLIVGARDVFTDAFTTEVKALALQDRVTIRSRVTDAELRSMYQTSGMVIQPSTSEGFGLTGVEALACHTPLVASDIPVFHEVYGDAAIYFSHDQPKELVSAIQHAATTDAIRAVAREAVLERCSWNRMTQTILAEIKTLLP